MAGEISADISTGIVAYAQIRNRTSGYIYNVSSGAFEVYNIASGNLNAYVVTLTEQGSSSHFVGNAPSTLGAGTYDVSAKRRINAWYAEADQLVANGTLEWNSAIAVPLSDLPASGVISQIRMTRGVMVQNYPIHFVSSSDHLTSVTSGVISGSISRDGASFGALQSGAFVEISRGWYRTNLTSGDLLANTVALIFSAVGVSGGSADDVNIGIVLQRSSGV